MADEHIFQRIDDILEQYRHGEIVIGYILVIEDMGDIDITGFYVFTPELLNQRGADSECQAIPALLKMGGKFPDHFISDTGVFGYCY